MKIIQLSKYIFLFLSIFLLLSSIMMFLNYLFYFSPNKIAVELHSTMVYSSSLIIFSMLLFYLFYFLHKKNILFITFYWITILLWLVIQVLISIPSSLNIDLFYIFFIVVFDAIPIIFGFYISIKKQLFFQQNSI